MLKLLPEAIAALKPPDKPEAPNETGNRKARKTGETGKGRLLKQHRVMDAILAEHRPNGVPDTELIDDVVTLLKKNWSWGCNKVLVDPTAVRALTWHPVAKRLGRWSEEFDRIYEYLLVDTTPSEGGQSIIALVCPPKFSGGHPKCLNPNSR